MNAVFKGTLVLAMILYAGAALAAQGKPISPTLKSKLAAQLNGERLAHLDIPQILAALEIDQAKAVLEIGAGAGVLTLPMAEKLKGRGTLVATDKDQELTGYLAEAAAAKQLDNLTVELNAQKTPQYQKGSFDRIVMLSVFEFLTDQTAFLKALLPSLQKGGKVYIIHPRLYPEMSHKRRLDLGYLASKLKMEGEKSPLAPYLSKEARAFIDQGEKADLKGQAFAALIKEFNAIAANPLFVRDFVQSKLPVTPAALKGDEGKDLTALTKKLKPLLGKKAEALSAADKTAVRTLGWLALKGRYIAPSGAMVGYDFTGPYPDSKEQVLAKARKAGLVLEAEKDFLPYYHLLIFKVQ